MTKLTQTLGCSVLRLGLLTMMLMMMGGLGGTGCMDKGAATTPPNAEESAENAAAEPPRTPEKSNRKGTGEGWRWSGDRDHCRFLVDKQCFKARADACTAAKCQDSTCVTSDAIPAQVSCR